MSIEMIRAVVAAAARVDLGFWPTPLQPCRRLQEEIGGPLVWLKRDDCSGLATGGNKTRKLEFLLGAAQEARATGVVTFGALQSNHARQTAAACARSGLHCDLVLTRSVDRDDDHYLRSGNVLLDGVLGAAVHVVDDAGAAAELAAALVADDPALMVVGPGGSDAVGSLGYVDAAAELLDQCDGMGIDPDALFLAASTGGTSAGLSVGFGLAGRGPQVIAAAVYEAREATAASIDRLVRATATSVGLDPADAGAWSVDDGVLGPGYGVLTAAARAAIERLARTEGVLLDPVYTAKAFALLLDRVAAGDLAESDDVVFLHTGGQAALFAYTADLGVGFSGDV